MATPKRRFHRLRLRLYTPAQNNEAEASAGSVAISRADVFNYN